MLPGKAANVAPPVLIEVLPDVAPPALSFSFACGAGSACGAARISEGASGASSAAGASCIIFSVGSGDSGFGIGVVAAGAVGEARGEPLWIQEVYGERGEPPWCRVLALVNPCEKFLPGFRGAVA